MQSKEAYFLGAGASLGAGIPLTRQFLPWLIENRSALPRLEELARFVEEFFSEGLKESPPYFPKFEQVLSFVDTALADNQCISSQWDTTALMRIRSDINYLIWRLLETSLPDCNPAPHLEFVQSLSKDSVLLTVNYDVLLDLCLLEHFGRVDYGIRFSKILTAEEREQKHPSPMLLKLHGSINWLYCPTCETFVMAEDVPSIRQIFHPDPVLCPYDQSYLRGILISPTWQKDYRLPAVALMWIKASKLLRDVERITIIGYSLSDIDMKVQYLLKRSTFMNARKPIIRVVDPDPLGKVARRAQRLFGPIEHLQMGFEDFVKTLPVQN